MKKLFLPIVLFISCSVSAQQFINSGMIEFEVRVNNHKVFGDGIWAEMVKERLPQFSTSYYQFVFNEDKAIYKFDRLDEKSKVRMFFNSNIEDNFWYNDYSKGTFIDQKFVFDDTYLLTGELMKIDWKMVPNETREIAGFNCRKAYGIIFDSVYVFAFYTDEITVSGGPMGIHGLPGMIMGITIPRMFSSWIATKLQVTGVDIKQIAAPKKGKKKESAELQATVEKVTKDWGTWGRQAIWNIFL